MKFAFISEEKVAFPVAVLCRLLCADLVGTSRLRATGNVGQGMSGRHRLGLP